MAAAIGGLVALLLHKTVGEVGTYIVLFIAWLVLLLSILPVKSVHKKVKALLFGSDIIDEEDLPQEVSKQQVKNLHLWKQRFRSNVSLFLENV